jgi:hypothetical protein
VEPKYILCQDNKGNENTLVVGKEYRCVDISDGFVYVQDEKGIFNWYCIEGFIVDGGGG